MKLYYSPGACSLSPHIVAREAGFDIALERVDLGKKTTKGGGDFNTVNPKGYVPALQIDGGEILTEGPAIVQYLADQRPESNLAPPAGTLQRYRLQEWLNFISTELHKQFSPLFNPKVAAEYKEMVKERLAGRFDYLVQQLAGKQFLLGDHFTVADAYLFTVLAWTDYVKVDLERWPQLKEYQARIAARPAVQAALKAEGLQK
jgi:glutathione S-transferase